MIRPQEVVPTADEKVLVFVPKAVGGFRITLSAALTVLGGPLEARL